MERMIVRPSRTHSYEGLMHRSGAAAFMLHLRDPRRSVLRDELIAERLERAIGVVYRPESEVASHYFHASLPRQFDELVWIDETHAVTPLATRAPSPLRALLETYPFGL